MKHLFGRFWMLSLNIPGKILPVMLQFAFPQELMLKYQRSMGLKHMPARSQKSQIRWMWAVQWWAPSGLGKRKKGCAM